MKSKRTIFEERYALWMEVLKSMKAAAEAEAAALAANPVSNSFATDANGDLVNTKQAVTRTRLPDGGSLVSITILSDKRALN